MLERGSGAWGSQTLVLCLGLSLAPLPAGMRGKLLGPPSITCLFVLTMLLRERENFLSMNNFFLPKNCYVIEDIYLPI